MANRTEQEELPPGDLELIEAIRVRMVEEPRRWRRVLMRLVAEIREIQRDNGMTQFFRRGTRTTTRPAPRGRPRRLTEEVRRSLTRFYATVDEKCQKLLEETKQRGARMAALRRLFPEEADEVLKDPVVFGKPARLRDAILAARFGISSRLVQEFKKQEGPSLRARTHFRNAKGLHFLTIEGTGRKARYQLTRDVRATPEEGWHGAPTSASRRTGSRKK